MEHAERQKSRSLVMLQTQLALLTFCEECCTSVNSSCCVSHKLVRIKGQVDDKLHELTKTTQEQPCRLCSKYIAILTSQASPSFSMLNRGGAGDRTRLYLYTSTTAVLTLLKSTVMLWGPAKWPVLRRATATEWSLRGRANTMFAVAVS